jgi:hypothetical protein
MSTPAVGDKITVVLVRRCYRGRVVEVDRKRPVFSVLLVNNSYDGVYWFGVHEEAWARGWGDDVEAALVLQQSA